MERAVRWGRGHDDGRPGPRPDVDPAYEWRGARLRPTGVVVFATLEADPALTGARRGRPGLAGATRPALTAGGDPGGTPRRGHRHRPRSSGAVLRAAAGWLLGR